MRTSPQFGRATPTPWLHSSPDAELVTAAGTFCGREAIVGFSRDLAFGVEDL